MKWEYKKLQTARDDKAATEQLLNELGNDGWELVSVNEHQAGFLAWLKRAMNVGNVCP
jgi:Domain of unknown function (DUF4177)